MFFTDGIATGHTNTRGHHWNGDGTKIYAVDGLELILQNGHVLPMTFQLVHQHQAH